MSDVEASRRRLLEDEGKYRMNTDGDFFYRENYVKLDNTRLAPDECARLAAEALGLPTA